MGLMDELTTHDANDAAREAALSAARGDAQQAHNDLTVALGQRDTAAAQVATLTAQVADLQRQLAAAQTPPKPATLFGADAEGSTLVGQTAKVVKWGKGIAIRQFFTAFTSVAPRSADVGRVHASWKPASVAAITDTAVTAAVANLLPGDVVEVWHEADGKVRAGTFTMAEAVARKNAFYDTVKRVRPDLLVANTLTGWEANPKNTTTGGNIDKWAVVKADLLGLDCDGVHGWPYPTYDGPIATAVAFLVKFPAYKGWCVPEFGTSRDTTNDADGTVRAKWAADYAAKFAAAGARHVALYEYSSTVGNAFTTVAELAAWSSLT